MRTAGRLATALTLAALVLPAAARAQTDRLFKNSWFWGAKGGVMSYSTSTTTNGLAALGGAEWLITRTRFGLYLSGDQAFFNGTSAVSDFMGGTREVAIKNMFRFTLAGLAFPRAFGSTLRPYGGLGFALNTIRQAEPKGSFDSGADEAAARDQIREAKDRASVLAMVGVQAQFWRVMPFAQATAMPSHVGFLLDKRATYFLEGGIRLNLGSAIEKP